MPRKRHKPEEIVAKLRQVDVLMAQGQSTTTAVKAVGVTEQSHYRRRREFGGLKLGQVKHLKELEAENARLRTAVSELTLDKLILKEAMRGKWSAPPDAAKRSIGSAGTSASPTAGPAARWANPAPPSAASPRCRTTKTASRPTWSSWRVGTAGTGTAASPPC